MKEFEKQNIDSEILQQQIRPHDQETEQLMNEDHTTVQQLKDYGCRSIG